jgi:hypothetical protein
VGWLVAAAGSEIDLLVLGVFGAWSRRWAGCYMYSPYLLSIVVGDSRSFSGRSISSGEFIRIGKDKKAWFGACVYEHLY